jgi:hypothetical protein
MQAINDHSAIREQAVDLRLAGKSLREIKEIVGPVGNSTLNEMLRGIAPPDWTRRPNAKDDVRAEARKLRAQGVDYNTIAAQLGVSKSSVSLWVRDMPRPVGLSPEERARRASEGQRGFWERERAYRDEFRAEAGREIGQLTDREVLMAGAVAYWCEGTKSKPWRNDERVVFTNSDPRLVRMFQRFLDVAGARRTDVDLPGQHPRERRRRGRAALLGGGHRGTRQPVQHPVPKADRRIEGWVAAITAAPSK